MDEWLSFTDEFGVDREVELNKVETGFKSLLDGEHSVLSILNAVSTIGSFDTQSVREIVVQLLLSCGENDFDDIKQRALVSAVVSDIQQSLSIRNHAFQFFIDENDLQLSFLHSKKDLLLGNECLVSLNIFLEDGNFANAVMDVLNELLVRKSEDKLQRNWPSLVGRIQEELLGQDGSDWDRSSIPFSVSVVEMPRIRPLTMDFFAFSTKSSAFHPPRKKVERLLILGSRDPHKNDVSKWILGLPEISKSPSIEINPEDLHLFTVLVSSDHQYDFRRFIFESQMRAISPKLKNIIIASLDKISWALSQSDGSTISTDVVYRMEFISTMKKLELRGPVGEKFTFSTLEASEIFDRADVEKKDCISKTAFLQFWESEKVQYLGTHSPNVRKTVNIQNLQAQVRASGAALRESQSLAHYKMKELRAQSKAALLCKRAKETTDSCFRKIEKANSKLRSQREILESGTSDESAVKTAQAGIQSAKRMLASAQSELEKAKKQEAVALSAMAEASDASEAVDDASGALDYFEEIRKNIQILAPARDEDNEGISAVRELFNSLDVNQDAQLSAKEFCTGIKNLLRERGIVVKRGSIQLICGWLDSDGSGFVDLNEFLDALQSSSKGRAAMLRTVSFEGLACLARYPGNARIMWEGAGGEDFCWQPRVSEDQRARGRFFNAIIGPNRPGKGFKIAFTRSGPSGSSLYHEFTDLPEHKSIIFQVCQETDIFVHCSIETLHALDFFIERGVDEKRLYMMSFIVRAIISRIRAHHDCEQLESSSYSGHGTAKKSFLSSVLESEILRHALEVGVPAEAISDPRSGLLVTWHRLVENASLLTSSNEDINDHDKVRILLALVEKEVDKAKQLWATWTENVSEIRAPIHAVADVTTSAHIERRLSNLGSSPDGAAVKSTFSVDRTGDGRDLSTLTINNSVKGKLFTCWNPALLKLSKPIIVQAPELYDLSFQHPPDSIKLLETFRFYFPDPSCEDSLESQLKRQFEHADKDKSGRLDRTELADLIRRSVNGDKESRTSKRFSAQESRYTERLNEQEIRALIDIIDEKRSSLVSLDYLREVLIPRGSACPYDQMKVTHFFARGADRILVLIDPAYSSSNAWERCVIESLYSQHKDKLFFASFVTVSHQETHSWSEIQKLVISSATYFSSLTRSESVGAQLRENVFGVRVSTNPKQADLSSWKRFLRQGLDRIVSAVFSSEEEHAVLVIRMTADAVRILAWFLGRALRRELRSSETEGIGEAEALAFSNAANTILFFCARAKNLVRDLVLRVFHLKIQDSLNYMRTILKKSKIQASKVLNKLGMDGKSKSELSAALEKERYLAHLATTALKGGDVLQWDSHQFTAAWTDMVQKRCKLKPSTHRELDAVLRDCTVHDLGAVVQLDISSLVQKLKDKNAEAKELTAIVHELNKVRSTFWKIRTKRAQRSLWLLVREQYLCIDDLSLFYSMLRGDLAVPAYLLAALEDALELLTFELGRDCPLRVVEVSSSFKVVDYEGRFREISCLRRFFTDAGEDSASQAVRTGKISAETASELLMAIRREVTRSIGWYARE